MTDPIAFVFAALVLLLSPGPSNALHATAGAVSGARSVLVPHIIAAGSAYAIAITAYRLLLGPAFTVYPSLGSAAKLILAGYVAWLAVKLWRAETMSIGEGSVSRRDVFVTTLLNPKALVAALTLFPTSDEGIGWYSLGYGGLVVICCTAWVVLGAALGRATPDRYRWWLPRAGSVALTAFAGVVVASALG